MPGTKPGRLKVDGCSISTCYITYSIFRWQAGPFPIPKDGDMFSKLWFPEILTWIRIHKKKYG